MCLNMCVCVCAHRNICANVTPFPEFPSRASNSPLDISWRSCRHLTFYMSKTERSPFLASLLLLPCFQPHWWNHHSFTQPSHNLQNHPISDFISPTFVDSISYIFSGGNRKTLWCEWAGCSKHESSIRSRQMVFLREVWAREGRIQPQDWQCGNSGKIVPSSDN